ncbi:flagellar basal body rod protein FlgB [Microbulbifer thermotolerans]|uniref:flagellar basal body rod protein FlgB n=1 Tax=Microbulbifer thermotolerans TaxID=252514 RepID=UPI0008E6F979|nr:flagellar basal body rod protein FlgB [Microbulbifer thermotolerans]MCX2783492.1 flagellar basal body rod protein FlgB [Microbulbifer thermotolerans]MCX2795886.1 flagellar basal body rod protein FlgB [Microbulbifer thermotolerans]MCX2835544.1 flagellar basal body rod protein FlgB [Microbulbifer thermotolerans]WKT59756.1 flagellar basal body rod protein FlgB [Microbulbifer thermotolerans]SFC61420.1 flagellar basal-body rod protein FlgB [Microbulbifer thermotolerans]
MIDRLAATLNFDREALNLRHERQKVLAGNIANADTPTYKARDFDFSRELARAVERGGAEGGLTARTTSPRHLSASASSTTSLDLLYRVPDQPSLDGNTVNMDVERSYFADNSVRYQAALTILNGRIQGLKSAMQSE